jgi:hypothetical protein
MSPIRPLRTLLAVALSLALALPSAATAQPRDLSALELVPAELPLVLLVPNLRGLSDAVARFNGGLAIDEPMMADLLGTFRTVSGFSRGLDDAGSVLLAATDLTSFAMTGTVPLIAFFPISSYPEFLANFGAAAGAAGAVSALTLPVTGEEVFVREVGRYALIGDDRAAIEAYAAPTGATAAANLGAFGTTYATSSDAVLLFNAGSVRELGRALLASGLGAWDSLAGQAGMGAMTSSIVALYGQLADSFLRDLDTAVLTFDVGTEGFGVSGSLRFLAGSAWGGAFAPAGAGATYLDGLPDRPWLMVSGMDLSGLHVGTILDQYTSSGDAQTDAWARVYTQAFETMRGVRAMGSAMYRPEAGGTAEGAALDTVNYYVTDDAAAYVDRFASYYTELNGVALSLGSFPSADGATVQEQSMTYRSGFERAVAEVGGATAHRFQLQVEYSDPTMQLLMESMSTANFSDMSGLVAASGDRVVMVTGTEEARLAAALTSLAAGGGVGADSALADLRSHSLIEAPAGEIYMRMDGFLGFFLPGAPDTLDTGGGEAQPLAAFVHTGDATLAGRMYLPYSSVVSFIHAMTRVQALTPM